MQCDKIVTVQYQLRILRTGVLALFTSSSDWGWGTGRECGYPRQTVYQAGSIDHVTVVAVNFKGVTNEILNENSISP